MSNQMNIVVKNHTFPVTNRVHDYIDYRIRSLIARKVTYWYMFWSYMTMHKDYNILVLHKVDKDEVANIDIAIDKQFSDIIPELEMFLSKLHELKNVKQVTIRVVDNVSNMNAVLSNFRCF